MEIIETPDTPRAAGAVTDSADLRGPSRTDHELPAHRTLDNVLPGVHQGGALGVVFLHPEAEAQGGCRVGGDYDAEAPEAAEFLQKTPNF